LSWQNNNPNVVYRNLQQLFDLHLEQYLRDLRGRKPAELYHPEAYIISLGGKRIRPLLALIGCELAGGKPGDALNCALSVEIFHNFSLVHDDILDAAPLRRSKATVHKQFGLNLAILGGDAMLVRAFSCLQHYPDPQFRELTSLLQRTAIEVCEGQQLDMNFESSDAVSVNGYVEMISLKTAVLLGCSLEMGAICAGADAGTRRLIYNFGKHLGIAFQLLDDLLDCFPSASQASGKRTGGDIAANKKTFLWLRSLELAGEAQRKKLLELASSANEEEKIRETIAIFTDLGVHDLCRAEADRHTRLAIGFLEEIKGDEIKKEQLRGFALDLLQRQS
jgi:geranylgeranyl diphosphate synthase, type II